MFDPRLDLDCYYVSVDADRYHYVALQFADGTTAEFDGEYRGLTEFGFSGDGRLESNAETTVDRFHGPIKQATVSGQGHSATVVSEGPCVFDGLKFDCDSVRHNQGDDVRVAFVDGSFKQWDPPTNQRWFGSPGRVIESITEESVDVTVENPEQDCQPKPAATVFDDDTVTIEPAEFTGEPTFEQATLEFVDGTTETFGTLGGRPTFSAPQTFTGSYTNEPIAAVVIQKQGGDVVFRLVNPAVRVRDGESTSGSRL